MTNELISSISPAEEQNILGMWKKAFSAREGEIIEYAQVNKLLEEMSSIEAFEETPIIPIPGGFSCSEDPKVFYIVYKELCGEEAAKMVLEHELEHYGVYKKYRVPTNFAVVISKLPDGRYFIIPLVSPIFPKDMPTPERLKIAHEANAAVTAKSKRDQKMIDQYTKE